MFIENLKNYVEGLGIPSWGTIDKMKYERGVLTITYCYYYRIVIDKKYQSEDGVVADEGWMWSKRDLEFAVNVLDERDDILKMIDDDVEYFEADLRDYTDGGMYPAHIKRYGEEEEVVE